ncbi:MAG: hypothetical protein ACRDE5_13665, partial [Ginsengibacter sp.]
PGGYSTPVFSKKFDNAQSDISLGDVLVNTIDVFTISGSITSCSGSPVVNGFIMMNGLRFVPDANGRFHFSTIVKNLGIYTNPGLGFAEEISTKQKSDLINATLVPGDNDIGNISVCGINGGVKVTCKLVDNSGNALPGLFVKIVPDSYPQNVYTTTSDSQGNVKDFYTYENTGNLLTVYGSLNCGNAIFSTNFTTTNRDTVLGNLTVNGLITATVTGSVVDCNNNPITSGHVIVQKDEKNYQYDVSSNGTFNFNIPICNATDSEPVIIIAEDNATSQTGAPVNVSLNDGNNNVGAISTCLNNSSLEFMNYTIDSAHYSLVSPVDPFDESVDPATHSTQIIGGDISSAGPGPGVFFKLTGSIAVGSSSVSIDEFDITPEYGRYVTDNTPQPVVNITD